MHYHDRDSELSRVSVHEPPHGCISKPKCFIFLWRSDLIPFADAQTRQACNANRSRCDISFQIGDQVLLLTSNLRTVSGLQPQWIGPFPVKTIINPVAVQLDLPKAFRMRASFHVSQIRHYNTLARYLDCIINHPPPVSAESAS